MVIKMHHWVMQHYCWRERWLLILVVSSGFLCLLWTSSSILKSFIFLNCILFFFFWFIYSSDILIYIPLAAHYLVARLSLYLYLQIFLYCPNFDLQLLFIHFFTLFRYKKRTNSLTYFRFSRIYLSSLIFRWNWIE